MPVEEKENIKYMLMPLDVSIIVSVENKQPILEIRRKIQDIETMKKIVSCAFNGIPIVVVPTFSNKIKSMSSLISKGIIYKEGNMYYFNI
jgi:hypothetical protein